MARLSPLVALLLGLLLGRSAPGTETVPDAAAVEFFEKKVRPLLAARCTSCHGAEDKVRGGLRLDSREALLRGGDRGAAIVPGQPDQSLLIRAIHQTDEPKMPPRAKLPPAEIAVLTAWVKMGAPWPAASPAARSTVVQQRSFTVEEKAFWAFRPVVEPRLPSVKDRQWAQSPLDLFILAKLEAKGLTPAPVADRRTLIRRATFDLTGLPPTPAEVEAFVRDESPDAFARVVERLLVSPAYGERWGRHWLDVARYADSNGMDENLGQANAFRYRDYVVASFNRDKPFDQFVREQLAGDLLPAAGPEGFLATGFLSLGPKMLAEDDPVKMEMDIVDEQVDTVGKTLLGLTLGCARCHDHKFDPVSQSDYYSLAGIFKSTKTMDHFKVVARWHERPVGTPAEVERLRAHDGKLDATKATIARTVQTAGEELQAEARRRTDDYVRAGRELVRLDQALRELKPVMADPRSAQSPGVIVREAEDFTRGNVKKEFAGYGEKIGVIYNAGPLPNFAEYDLAIEKAGVYRLELRYAAAQARPVKVLLDGKLLKANAAGSATGSWYPDTQTWFVAGLVSLRAGSQTLRLEREQPFPHFDKLALVPWQPPADAALPAALTAEELAVQRGLNPVFLQQWARHLEKHPELPQGEELAKVLADPRGPLALSTQVEACFPTTTITELKRLRSEQADLEKSRPVLPEAMAVEEGKATNLRIHLRGSHLTLGAEVPRQFPRILAGEGQPPIDATQSGRLQLAEWITRPDHPLTARVLVNRLWHWHFGMGLVRSTDNFGQLGERPSHPELLDWLARRFVESGWSMKALHRLLMLSSTYQMSGAYEERAALLDPDNRLRWRWSRRRLEAEALRDALLAVSGRLERTMGGSLFKGGNRAYVPGYPNTTYDQYDFERRSLYLPVIRSDLYSVLQAFDFADPSTPNGERAVTTVAPQALFLMNGKLVVEQARHLARSLLQETGLDDAGRVYLAYERAYSRPPTERDTSRALEFVAHVASAITEGDPAERRLRAWQGLCRVLLAASEFVYIE